MLPFGWEVEWSARFQQTFVHRQAELVANGCFVYVSQTFFDCGDVKVISFTFFLGIFVDIGSSRGLKR